jgi:ketosteroid isomerase-like protein
MGSANVELVRSIFAAWERGDYSPVEWAHPEVEYVIADGPAQGTWSGLAAMAEAAGDFLSVWEEFRILATDYRELDDERVLVFTQRGGRGKMSGLDLGQVQAKGAHLFRVRDGKVTKVVAYNSREHALADLGLASQSSPTHSLERRRHRADRLIAPAIVVMEILLCLTLWGPQPAAWLWVGSQVNHQTDSLIAGLLLAFFGTALTMVGTITFAAWLDRVWRLVRSPSGFEQQEGVLSAILVTSAVIAVPCFLVWWLVIEGPGDAPGMFPMGHLEWLSTSALLDGPWAGARLGREQ